MLRVTHLSRPTWALCIAGGALLAACSSSSDDASATPAVAAPSGGPVSGPADRHCTQPGGQRIVRAVHETACHPRPSFHPTAGTIRGLGVQHAVPISKGAPGGVIGNIISAEADAGTLHVDAGAQGDGGARTVIGAVPIEREIAGVLPHTSGGATNVRRDVADAVSPQAQIRFGSAGSDDACKYDLAFSATPIRTGDEVTFTLVVTRRADGSFASDASPIAIASLNGRALSTDGQQWKEDPQGVYHIGPIRFDASGRWQVKFVLYDACADGMDSPKGEATFWVEVP